MCFGGERRVGIRLRRASYFSFVPSHETPRAPQPTLLSPPKHINSDWVRVCFRPQSSPYFLRKPRTRNSETNGLGQNKMSVTSCVKQVEVGAEWVTLRREVKNTSKKYDRNLKRKNKRKKTRKEKEWQFRSLEGVEKLVLSNPFPRRSITKRQKCSTLKLNIYHKNLAMKDVDNL